RTPSFPAVISVETLSVSKVKSASPALTSSPDFLCHTETIPLVIDSPTAGTLTSVLMKALHYAQSKPVVTCQMKTVGRLCQTPAGDGVSQKRTTKPPARD